MVQTKSRTVPALALPPVSVPVRHKNSTPQHSRNPTAPQITYSPPQEVWATASAPNVRAWFVVKHTWQRAHVWLPLTNAWGPHMMVDLVLNNHPSGPRFTKKTTNYANDPRPPRWHQDLGRHGHLYLRLNLQSLCRCLHRHPSQLEIRVQTHIGHLIPILLMVILDFWAV